MRLIIKKSVICPLCNKVGWHSIKINLFLCFVIYFFNNKPVHFCLKIVNSITTIINQILLHQTKTYENIQENVDITINWLKLKASKHGILLLIEKKHTFLTIINSINCKNWYTQQMHQKVQMSATPFSQVYIHKVSISSLKQCEFSF